MYNASYPVNVTLDIGNNGIIEFNHSDILNGTVNTTTNLTIALNALAPDCTCSGCSIANNVSCLVPVTVTSATQGSVILTHLNITQQIRNYTLSQFVNQTALDLDDYFFDENNDSLNYTVVFRAATDTATLLYCSLDSSLSCASGDTGTSDAGYSEAVFSSGIRINSSTNLTFISGDVLDISKGTFEAWVVPDWNGSTGARYVLLDMNATGAGNSMSIYKNESGYLVAEILDASVNSYKVTYNISSWLDHQKHHIVFSWNTNDMQLAVDGKVQDTLSSATMPTATSSLTYIGSSMNNTDHFNGTIDELKISNRVRTDYYNVSNLSYSINAENILTFIPDRYYNGSLVATYISDDGHARTFSNRFNLTILPDTLSPIVTLLTSSATIYNQNLTLSYNVSENIDIASCNMYHNLTHTFELNQSTVFTGFNQTASFAFIALPDLATFIWNVECVDIYGNNAFASENRTISIVYPIDAPATINSSYNSTVQNGVRLDWNDVTYATGYVIQTSSDLQIFTNLTTVSESNYTDTSANNVATRYYKIVAQKPGYANASTILLGKQNYTLKEKSSGTTKNWFGYIFNNTRIQKAKDLLYDIPNASAIVMYNSTLQITVTCNKATCPDICTATTCNFNLSAGQQYEVLMENNIGSMEYTYTGNVLDPVVVTLVKNTTSYGKNWISVPANTTLTTASTLLNNISTANSVSKWDAATQKSQGWISLFGGLGTNFNIEPRAGYEVSVTSNFNWTQR